MSAGSTTYGHVDSLYIVKNWSGLNGKGSSGVPQWNPYTMNYGKWRVVRYGNNGPLSGGVAFSFPSISAASNSRLYSKMVDSIKTHDFNLGVFIGTGNQTLKLATDTVYRLASSVRSLRRLDFGGAARALGVVPSSGFRRETSKLSTARLRRAAREGRSVGPRLTSNDRSLEFKDVSAAWLELQYGWAPLLQDVHAAAVAYSLLTAKPRTQTHSVSVTESGQSVDTSNFVQDITVDWKSIYTLTCIQVEQLSQARGLGLLDPATVVWELIPFSFVVDWFIPIGNYLDGLNVIPNVNGTWHSSSYQVGHMTRVGKYGGDGVDYRNALSIADLVIHNRVVNLPKPSMPLPVFKSFEKTFSTAHLKNGLALLHQLLT